MNVFDTYKPTTKRLKIEALDGAEVEVKELTLGELSSLRAHMIKAVDDNGKPTMDSAKVLESKFYKVSAMLVNPKMTVQQLKGLSQGAQAAIDEILLKAEPTAGNLPKS